MLNQLSPAPGLIQATSRQKPLFQPLPRLKMANFDVLQRWENTLVEKSWENPVTSGGGLWWAGGLLLKIAIYSGFTH